MRVKAGPRPLAIRIFAAAFLAAALLRLVRGLGDLALSQMVFAVHAPWLAWNRDWTIVALSAEFTIALIPLAWIYLFAAPFARWLVLGFGALRLAFFDPEALVGPVLIALAMLSLLTAQAGRWFARTPDREDGPAVFE
ncbi:hypothetical protein [Erythrobacter sanguineus]|jgi:hypothetical protein|uniref:DoxX-like family protein n=1 Tax=Erythrobacter sanguineus TaxID=198312 RepID=A0A1M7SZU8_9SPHN|nr:hypothetical protein [Erythrobacter sanguineus]SHN64005.1 hypothetical protein SAMN02745193_02662 [Erythrobacter sanguineus]